MGVGTGVRTVCAAAGSVAAGVATGSEFAGDTFATGVAAAGLTVAAGTATGAAVTGMAGSATGVVVVPPITEAGVAAGLAAAVLVGTGVASAAGVRGGARSEEDAMVAGADVTDEAVAGVIVRETGGGEGLGLLPMPKVSKRPPKKPSGGRGGMYPGCALVGWLDSRTPTRQRSRAGWNCIPLHLCCPLLPFFLRLRLALDAVSEPRSLRCGFSET